jgi:hypothetical protein
MTDITFFSHIATGLAAAAVELPIDDQLQIPVTLNVTAQPSGVSHAIHQTVGLYRPCDVIGLDPRAILRTDPDHRVTVGDFEPNYLPIVEFAAADLPWRFTTEQPISGRRTPWLALVVLAEGEYEELRVVGGSEGPRPPGLRIHEPSRVLPPARQIGAWAHGQGAGALSTATPADLESINSRSLTALRSRLIAARRLRPGTRYRACLIPTFECGRLRGLNPGAAHEHEPGYAWSSSVTGVRDFPVYFSWGFGTSAYGDIESLAERIEPRVLDPATGTRPLRVPDQEYEVPGTSSPMRYDGAVVSTDLAPAPEQPTASTDRLVEVLNAPAELAQEEEADATRIPAVAPPIYGQWHAKQHKVEVPSPEDDPKAWLSQLNGYFAYRAAAGLGAEVVRRDQEQLVAEAWRQVGDVLTAYRRVFAAQLGFLTSTRLYERTITKLSADTLLFLSRPVHGKLRNSGETTLLAELDHSNLRGVAQSAHTRAMLASNGVAKRAFRRRNAPFVAGDVVPGVAASEHIRTQFEIEIVDQTLRPFLDAAAASAADGGERRDIAERDLNASLGLGDGVGSDRSAELAGVQLAPIDVASVRTEVLDGVDPKATIPARINALIRGVDVSSPTSLCNPVMPGPEFDTPMYAPLRDLSPSYVLPGVGDIPQNTAALLASNQEFLEAYLAGLNYEMASELLWRGYPATDLRATYFKYFWDSAGDFADITPIPTWTGSLRSNRGSGTGGEPLVLLLRADLNRRYPGIIIYAQRAAVDESTGEYQLGSGDGAIVEPIFRGELTPDTIVIGFNLSADVARGDDQGHGYFFVLQEQPRESRFGFDEAEAPSGATQWGEITWADITPSSHQSVDPWDGPIDLELATAAALPARPTWNGAAAEMAEILFQRPYRIALHGKRLLPAPPQEEP